ncbi:VOC family protein [Psychromarinibacter sp. C21-152]|uniref:VOC family protein n=1 Tax=Psychromarinibacter sediminicola TaxID=3033385 RepID=A0AAE3NRJ2_9RHOB|nr:VOC family protein [Psychromarinibacter sediminicola]MDF0602973.1 VOC family protein [Psychromarinibacter sediminicola]
MSVIVLDHLVLTVADIEATVAFYGDVLGMLREEFHGADGAPRVAVSFGSQKINLHAEGDAIEPRAVRPVPGSADLCFLSDVPLETWQEHFDAQGVPVIDGPVARTGATGPITSLYIRDPDGNLIEVSVRD